MKFYFDHVYNHVYDFMVGQNAPYVRLQNACIEKLELNEGDRVLCAGVGTGNEILRILEKNRNTQIVGIDSSKTALLKIKRKMGKLGKELDVRLMDVQNMEFTESSFDKVLCVHVTDFVPDYTKAASEIIRVLKDGGSFAITFPSDKEDFSLGLRIANDAIHHHIKSGNFIKTFRVIASTIVSGFVYLPFLFRSEARVYKKNEVTELFAKLTKNFQIEDFPVYSDFIVYGRKYTV